MPYIRNQSHDIDLTHCGGKAAALGHLASAKLPIPDWIVIDPGAFYASVSKLRLIELERSVDATHIQRLLADLTPPAAFLQELNQALADLSPKGERVAVRSSAVDEDSDHLSTALRNAA